MFNSENPPQWLTDVDVALLGLLVQPVQMGHVIVAGLHRQLFSFHRCPIKCVLWWRHRLQTTNNNNNNKNRCVRLKATFSTTSKSTNLQMSTTPLNRHMCLFTNGSTFFLFFYCYFNRHYFFLFNDKQQRFDKNVSNTHIHSGSCTVTHLPTAVRPVLRHIILRHKVGGRGSPTTFCVVAFSMN